MVERLVKPELAIEDQDLEASLRPCTIDEYIGQKRVRENLRVFIRAAQERGEALDHVLLYGPPGLGKTTLANIVANELGVQIRSTSGPAIERAGDLAAILTNLEARDVLFIDEIHRLSHTVEEILYPAMEDFNLDLVIGKGPGARSVKLDLPPFTLVGATTRAGLLTSPLRDRFGIINRLDYYQEDELELIVKRAARILGIILDDGAAREIARRSRGTPRIANRLLRRVRDFVQVSGSNRIDYQAAAAALNRLEVDALGLDEIDRRLLEAIAIKFAGGPVGLDTLAAMIGEDSGTIEEVYEPYLLQLGFIQRTPRGRIATPRSFQHLGLEPPAAAATGDDGQ